jgi:cytosine/adenosine deaminase-related metal-dependent hydrolase
VRPGLSPHAPYSVSAPLFQGAAARAAALGLPLAVHVAESPEELEFLARGTGAMRELLEELGALPAGFRPPGVTPVAWLARLGLLERRPLLVHANYLDADDVARIRESGSAVAFCPRSHRFFGYDQCSVPRLLEAGVTVALGTDSLASAPSLDLVEEVRALAGRVPLAPARALHLATRAGGEALGLPQAGRLAPGGPADFTAWRIPAGARDPLEAIVDGSATRVASVVVGRRFPPG